LPTGCYVRAGMVRRRPEDPQECLVLARRIEEDETILIELFSPSEQYQIRVHKLTFDSLYRPAGADPGSTPPGTAHKAQEQS
jgi:hypothetical protein